MRSAVARTTGIGALLIAMAIACAAVAIAAKPTGGATYTNRGKGLLGTLTVAKGGRSITTMTLEFPIPYCVNGDFSRLTRIPATDIPIKKSGAFTVSGTVANGGQDDPSAPAKTTISGRFLTGGKTADVAIEMVIDYPSGHPGCTTQTVKNHGTFTRHKT